MASPTSGGLMKSIFGGGPQALTNQRYATIRSEADDIINTTNKIQSPGEAIGGAFGTPFGKEFGAGLARGLLGDPEMEAAQQEEAFLQELSRTYEINSPEFLNEFAKYKQSQGDFDKASQLTELSNQIQGKLLTAQDKEIREQALGILFNNPNRQDQTQEYLQAGGDPKVLIDLFKEKDSDSKYKVVGNNIFDTETGEYILSPKKGAGAGAGANEEPKKLKPKKYLENIINPDGSQSVNSVEILLDEEGNYYDADQKPITDFSKRGYVAFDATTYKTMSADAQRQADLLDKNRTAMYKLHSITSNPAAANVLGPSVSKQGATRLAESAFATGSQNEIVLKNINEFRIEGVLGYLKDLGGSDTEREFAKLAEGLPEKTNDVNVWKDYQLNTVFNVIEKVLNKTEETRETAKKEVSAMLDDFDPSELKLIKDGGLIKPNGYVHRLIKSGKYTPSLNTDNFGKNRTEQLDSIVSKILSNTGN